MSKKETVDESPKGIWGFFKKIESDITKWFIGTICTMLCLSVPFYFNTTSAIEAHNQKITTIQTAVNVLTKDVTTLEGNPGFNADQIKSIKKIVEEIQLRQQRLEMRQDKMYDLMIEMAKK